MNVFTVLKLSSPDTGSNHVKAFFYQPSILFYLKSMSKPKEWWDIPIPMRECKKCKEEKPATSFYVSKDKSGNYYRGYTCKSCHYEQKKKYMFNGVLKRAA